MKKILLVIMIFISITLSSCFPNDNTNTECDADSILVGEVCVKKIDSCDNNQEYDFETESCQDLPLVCELGTHEENGECVDDPLQCDIGTHEENGACVDDPLQCETGYHEEDGACVVDPLECPTGYHEEDQTCVIDKIEETPSSLGYATGISVQAGRFGGVGGLPEKYFNATFYDIEYFPVLDKVCFKYDIYDPQRRNATYYLFLQDNTNSLMSTFMIFNIYDDDFSSSDCFGFPGDHINYSIALGKVDIDDLNPTTYIEEVAWFSISDAHMNERKQFGGINISENSTEYIDSDQTPYVDFDVTIEDPQRTLTKLEIGIYDPEFHELIEYISVDVNQEDFSGDSLTLDNIRLDGLSPGINYEVYYFITGNDGADDFSGLFYTSRSLQAAKYIGYSSEVYHGLYGVITNYETVDDNMVISYVYQNNDVIKYNDTNKYVELQLIVLDSLDNIIYQTELEEGSIDLLVPIEFFKYEHKIKIVDDRNEHLFAHVYLRNIEPEINGSHIEDSVLRFLFDDDRVTNIDIEFYVPGFPTPFETYQNYNDTPGENFQTIYHDLTYVTEIQVKYIITYIGYGETFVYTYSTVEKIY